MACTLFEKARWGKDGGPGGKETPLRASQGGSFPPEEQFSVNRLERLTFEKDGLKRNAFQTDNALERFSFEKGETRGGSTAPPGPK